METPVEVVEKENGYNPEGLDEALEKISPTPEPEAKPDKPALEVVKPDTEKPPVTGEDDTLSWVKGLDAKTLKDLREGTLIPKYRFDEVSGRMKLYESFGSPEELIQRLKAPANPAPDKVPSDAELNEEEREVKAQILKMFPYLKDIPKTQDEFNKFQTDFQKAREAEYNTKVADRTALIQSGESKIKTLAEAAGLPADAENLALLVGGVTDLLHAEKNKALADKFYRGDVGVLDQVFKDYFDRLYSGFQRKAKADLLNNKDKQAGLPKPPIKGGAPPLEPSAKKPKSFDEAGDAGWDMIKAAQ